MSQGDHVITITGDAGFLMNSQEIETALRLGLAFFRVDWMPFAGLRESGLGVGGIPYTFHDMRVEKLIVLRSAQL